MTDRILNGMLACYVTIGNLAMSDYMAQLAAVCVAKN